VAPAVRTLCSNAMKTLQITPISVDTAATLGPA
jgi:hypothetical protein